MKHLILALLLLSSLHSQAQIGYSNPVIPGFYPDPSVCRVGEDYYLVNSSFLYFPGVPIFHSKDLIHWEQIGHVLTTPEQLPLTDGGKQPAYISGGIYAPTIRYHKGTFYMITTNIAKGKNFLVTATDPKGPWSDPIWIDTPGLQIDPSLFFDEDEKVYLTTAPDQDGILFAQLDAKSGKLLTPLKSIWSGTGGRYPEGPHIYKKDGWYYLMIAEGGTEYGHKVVIARSRKIDGPYQANPDNPILTHVGRNAQSNPVQGVGHPDLVQASDGSWWMLVLAFRQHHLHHVLGRETFLVPVEWEKNKWPVVNKNGTLSLAMQVPTLPQHAMPLAPTMDQFDKEKLGFEWVYIGNPVVSNYSLTDRVGALRLTGNPSTVREGNSLTFVARRQQHQSFGAKTSLEFDPTNETDEAGLTVFMDVRSHYTISVRNIKGVRSLLVTYTLGLIQHVENQIPLREGPVQLKVEGSVKTYTFSFSQGGDPFREVGKADAKYLSSETAGGFTGVMLGLFATGNGHTSSVPAYFDWFNYQGNE